jgi:hypothetical protein
MKGPRDEYGLAHRLRALEGTIEVAKGVHVDALVAESPAHLLEVPRPRVRGRRGVGEDEVVDLSPQMADHRPPIFVTENAEHRAERPPRRDGGDGLGEHRGAVRVVRDVEDEAPDAVKPARDAHGRQHQRGVGEPRR